MLVEDLIPLIAAMSCMVFLIFIGNSMLIIQLVATMADTASSTDWAHGIFCFSINMKYMLSISNATEYGWFGALDSCKIQYICKHVDI